MGRGSAATILALSVLTARLGDAGTLAVRAPSAPRIDGVLEAAWNPGLVFDHFAQLEPDVESEAPVKTQAYFLYDSRNVYLAARLFQAKATIRSAQGRRDADIVEEGDSVTFVLDPLGNGNSAYFFEVNPANAIADGRVDAAGNWDRSWDGVFTTATQIGEDSWTVEILLPLSSVTFRGGDDQIWGLMCQRTYAQERRKLVSELVDENNPYQISAFHQLLGIHELAGRPVLSVTPYLSSIVTPGVGASPSAEGNLGADLRLRATPSMTILATVNPDFAQIESDREIINVTDVPTSYPEKRPFFTESSDLYPGLAVNTRRIESIRAGVKLRQVLPRVKADATIVEDEEGAGWLLGDVRWTDDATFHAELITGLRSGSGRNDYNVTTNLRGWWLQKRLTAYTWFGTINGAQGRHNEWESVNSVRWETRRLKVGLRNHFKSELYNPNVVGYEALSNEVTVWGWVETSIFQDSGWLRRLTPRVELDYTSLFTTRDGAFVSGIASLDAVLYLGPRLGDARATLSYSPPSRSTFRYRETGGYDPQRIQRDAYGRFVLEEQRLASYDLSIGTDPSRPLGLGVTWSEGAVRASRSHGLSVATTWKMGTRARVSYTLDVLSLEGSPFQARYREAVHRLKLEVNPTSRLNIRAIADLKEVDGYGGADVRTRTPTRNLTFSWEYRPGSFVYLVYNDSSSPARDSPSRTRPGGGEERSLALKISRNLVF